MQKVGKWQVDDACHIELTSLTCAVPWYVGWLQSVLPGAQS
jgi:hypothetical protein